MPSTLLREEILSTSALFVYRRTYLQKATELGVLLHLVFEPLLSQWKVPNIGGIRQSELSRGLHGAAGVAANSTSKRDQPTKV